MVYVVQSKTSKQFADKILHVISDWGFEHEHLFRFIKFVYALLDKNSNEYSLIINALSQRNKKDVIKMFVSVQDEAEARGEAKGEARGEARGIEIGKVEVYYNDLEWSPEQIAQKLDMDIEHVNEIISKF